MIAQEKTKKQEVLDSFMEHLHAGKLRPGDRMPSMRALADEFHVSIAVINDAYKVLTAQGLIIRKLGSGTYVNPFCKFRGTRLAALLTNYQHYHTVEYYYESLLDEAAKANVLVLPGVLPLFDMKTVESMVQDVLKRDPDLIMIDVEARVFPLERIMKLLKGRKVVFVNRWEWMDKEPEFAVLHDYTEAYASALMYLKDRGHHRILVNSFHVTPLPFMRKRLDDAAEKAGMKFGKDLYLLGQDTIAKNPECLNKVWRSFKPTAVMSLADILSCNFRIAAEQYCPELAGLERTGIFHTARSMEPGSEFASVPLDFARMWRTAFRKDAEGKITLVPPLKIIKNNASELERQVFAREICKAQKKKTVKLSNTI